MLCLPIDHGSASQQEVQQRWQSLLSTPLLAVFQAGAIENASGEVLRKIAVVWHGRALLAASVRPLSRRSRDRRTRPCYG